MTLKELKNKVKVTRSNGYCSYNVTIEYRGKQYTCHSNNSLAWDRLNDENYRDNEVSGLYTNKGAYQAFYDECKRKNDLGYHKGTYAYVTIRWKDDGKEEDAIIAVGCKYIESIDDQILFYCGSMSSFNRLKEMDNGEDFVITECKSFINCLSI